MNGKISILSFFIQICKCGIIRAHVRRLLPAKPLSYCGNDCRPSKGSPADVLRPSISHFAGGHDLCHKAGDRLFPSPSVAWLERSWARCWPSVPSPPSAGWAPSPTWASSAVMLHRWGTKCQRGDVTGPSLLVLEPGLNADVPNSPSVVPFMASMADTLLILKVDASLSRGYFLFK